MKKLIIAHPVYSLAIIIWVMFAGVVAWEEWHDTTHPGDWWIIIGSGLFIAACALKLDEVRTKIASHLDRDAPP